MGSASEDVAVGGGDKPLTRKLRESSIGAATVCLETLNRAKGHGHPTNAVFQVGIRFP